MNKLQKLEHKIEANIKKAWYENGLCLLEIRDKKLYKKYSTFEQYLKERWDFSKQQGYRLIDASCLYQTLEKIVDEKVTKKATFGDKILPANEGQVRALLALDSNAEQVHVWNKVVDTGENITAKVIKREVDNFKAHPEPVEEIEDTTVLTNTTSSKREVLYTPGSNDECYTPRYGVEPILKHLKKSQIIWCPFDKADSNFVRILQGEGFTVTYSHIDTGQDFYEYEPDKWDVIVSNPPFTAKRKIFERALSFGKPFALIMSNTWLNDAAPKQIFKASGLQLLMFEERMKFLNQDNAENKITFSSSYFCTKLLKHDIMFDSLKNYGY